MGSGITEKALKLLLEERYRCKCDGKPMPRPYCSEDELETYYITPSGHHFSVPPPPDGVSYSEYLFQQIIEAGKLNVVVDMQEKKDQSKPKKEES